MNRSTNLLRLVLLALCLATIVASVSSCDKEVGKPVRGNGTTAEPQKQYYFSHLKLYEDSRKPGLDTVWTLRLTTDAQVEFYRGQNGQVFEQTPAYVVVGLLWTK